MHIEMNGIVHWPRCITFFFPYIRCYSYVGYQGNKQILSLGLDCFYKGIILHEIGKYCWRRGWGGGGELGVGVGGVCTVVFARYLLFLGHTEF